MRRYHPGGGCWFRTTGADCTNHQWNGAGDARRRGREQPPEATHPGIGQRVWRWERCQQQHWIDPELRRWLGTCDQFKQRGWRDRDCALQRDHGRACRRRSVGAQRRHNDQRGHPDAVHDVRGSDGRSLNLHNRGRRHLTSATGTGHSRGGSEDYHGRAVEAA